MGAASSSTGHLRHDVMNEIRSIGNILEDLEKHECNFASLGGMPTFYEMFHSSLHEVKAKQTIKDGDQEVAACTEKTSVDIEENVFQKQSTCKLERTDTSSDVPRKKETRQATQDSIMDELNNIWDEASQMDDASAVFLLRFLCGGRLTLEKILNKIIQCEDPKFQLKAKSEESQDKESPSDTLTNEITPRAMNLLLRCPPVDSGKECYSAPDKGINEEKGQASPDKEFNKEKGQASPDKEFNKEKGQDSPDKEFNKDKEQDSPDKEEGKISPEKRFKEEKEHES